MASAKGFDFYMFCPPNSTTVSWRIVEINTGAETSGVATLNLPAATTLLTGSIGKQCSSGSGNINTTRY
jgi:hypothetical protein